MTSTWPLFCSHVGFLLLFCVVATSEAVSSIRGGSETPTERELYKADDIICLQEAWCRSTIGLILLCCTTFIICWNEKGHARLDQLYRAAGRVIRDVHNPFKLPHNNNLDGQFICISGTLEGGTMLKDTLFPKHVQADNALLMMREIEILQYVQTGDKDSGYELEIQWCKIPQRDATAFGKKNPLGNWNLFGGDQVFDTGHTVDGKAISMKDNLTVFRAPHPTLGAFAVPAALMNEGFLGARNVQRLHEYQRFQDCQGNLEDFQPPFGRSAISPADPKGKKLWSSHQGRHVRCRVHPDGYLYDGNPSKIGTIRIKWRVARTQTATIAAEAVAPGGSTSQGYGSNGYNLSIAHPQRVAHMGAMIVSETFQEEVTNEELQPLGSPKKPNKFASDSEDIGFGNSDRWTLTAFEVNDQSRIPVLCDQDYNGQPLGRLWLFAPGKMNAKQIFRKARRSNWKCLWIVRGVTYLLLVAGWALLFDPVARLFAYDSFPYTRVFSFVAMASILACSCGLASMCWATVTALACLRARPVLSTMIIAACWVVFILWHNRYLEALGLGV